MDKREDSLPPEDVLTADGLDHDPGHPPRETETELDEDDRLKPAFVRDVIETCDASLVESSIKPII